MKKLSDLIRAFMKNKAKKAKINYVSITNALNILRAGYLLIEK